MGAMPSTAYEIGNPSTGAPRLTSHSTSPVRSSRSRKRPSASPPKQTSGPIVAGGKVISGRGCEPAGGPDACIITAHDAATGTELWRRRTIPAPGEPGDETWGGVPFEVTRDGVETMLPLEPRRYRYPRYSPDGRLIAYQADYELWLFDRVTGSNERFAAGERTEYPVWSMDGRYVYYTASRTNLYRKPADGSTDAELLIEWDGLLYPLATMPGGDGLLLNEWQGAERGVDISILSLGDGDPSVRDFLRADHHEWGGDVSPDGEWVVYGSDESGSAGLYVRRLADATGQVSVPSGGRRLSRPRWSTDGSAVLWMDFVSGEPELLRSRVIDAGGVRSFAPPEGMLLVEGASRAAQGLRVPNWDASPDGERFVFVVDRDPESASQAGPRVEIVVNWFTELLALSGN